MTAIIVIGLAAILVITAIVILMQPSDDSKNGSPPKPPTPPSSTIVENTESAAISQMGAPDGYPRASMLKRFCAFTIDNTIFLWLLYLALGVEAKYYINFFEEGKTLLDNGAIWARFNVYNVLALGYVFLRDIINGQGVGKLLIGLGLSSTQGNSADPTFWQHIKRNITVWLTPFSLIEGVLAVFVTDKQRVSDVWAGTEVLDYRPRQRKRYWIVALIGLGVMLYTLRMAGMQYLVCNMYQKQFNETFVYHKTTPSQLPARFQKGRVQNLTSADLDELTGHLQALSPSYRYLLQIAPEKAQQINHGLLNSDFEGHPKVILWEFAKGIGEASEKRTLEYYHELERRIPDIQNQAVSSALTDPEIRTILTQWLTAEYSANGLMAVYRCMVDPNFVPEETIPGSRDAKSLMFQLIESTLSSH